MTRSDRAGGPDALSVALAELAIGSSPATDWQWIAHGSSNVVVLAGEHAVRIARNATSGAQLLRTQTLVDALPALPFAVPRSSAAPVEIDGRVAAPTQRIDGSAHPAGSGDPVVLGDLLRVMASIDPEPLCGLLAERRSFIGGSGWEQRMESAIEYLDGVIGDGVIGGSAVIDEARRRLARFFGLRGPHGFVHGDLAGANVLWREGRIVGVIDWDLATVDDVAIDVAALGAWHGWATMTDVVDEPELGRARIIADVAPLQALTFLLQNDAPAEEVEAFALRVRDRLSCV